MRQIVCGAVLAFFIALNLIFSANTAQAYLYGTSNLMLGGYPDPECRQPTPPYVDDEFSWQLFQTEADRYRKCVSDYVEAAENDSKAALEKANEAVRKYNSFVKSLR